MHKQGVTRRPWGVAQSLKEEYEADTQGWRQALAQRAKKELAAKEQELRAQLEAERDAQLELVCPNPCRTRIP